MQMDILRRWNEPFEKADVAEVDLDINQVNKLVMPYWNLTVPMAQVLRRIHTYYIKERGYTVEQIQEFNYRELCDRIADTIGIGIKPATWRDATVKMSNEELLKDMKHTRGWSATDRRTHLNSLAVALGVSPTDYTISVNLLFTREEWDEVLSIIDLMKDIRPKRGVGSLKPKRRQAVGIYKAITSAYGLRKERNVK